MKKKCLSFLYPPIVVISLVLAAGCGGDDGGDACTPGQSAACTCTNGDPGAQICQADNTFGMCSCSGAIDAAVPAPPDALVADAAPPVTCDPLAAPGAQGCGAGEKCTWITIQDTPESIGTVGCVPDGTVAEGGACTSGPVGETTGFDDCVAGNVCINSVCVDICGFDASPAAMCAGGDVCTRYGGLFANGDDDPIAGACTETCNPVTQMLSGGGMCPPGQGCYVLTSSTTTIAICAAAGTPTHGMPIAGDAFANSCAPGHQPRQPAPGATTWECGALCAPADVTSTTNMSSEGGVTPYSCESKGASPPDSATAGESCRYYWSREPFSELSPFSNTLGWCFKHAIYQYDTNGDMMPDAPFPRCITLTTGDVVPPIGSPPHNDAQYFWCVALPATATSTLPPAPVGRLDRIGNWR